MRFFNAPRTIRATAGPLAAALLCVSLAGCQQPRGPGASLAMDPSDPCRAERSEFAGSKTYFQDKIVAGAAGGALVGAGAGALAAAASGRTSARNLLAGALIGATVGGVAGASNAYFNTLAERARDQEELADYMNQDLAREAQEIDHTVATFARLRACRFGQAFMIKDQARARMLDRPTALARISFHRAKFDEEIRIAREFGVTMARRGQQFQEAASELRTRPPVAAAQGRAPVASRTTSQRVAAVDRAATVSVPEKRASFENSVTTAERNAKPAFDLDSNANLSRRHTADADA